MSAEENCCREVRIENLERIHTYLDGELSRAQIAAIEEHLSQCAACDTEYEVEAMLKELVRRSCHRSAVPEGLQERIRTRIRVEVVSQWSEIRDTTG